ncbi:uncharacterized protein ACR2FA_005595 [Aphomia sociella]
MDDEPLQLWPLEKWDELEAALNTNSPHTIPGYIMLDHQRDWSNLGVDHEFKVYCPYADARNGTVAINDKQACYEIIIQCSKDKTEKIVEALKNTKIINWKRTIIILPFTTDYTFECIKSILDDLDLELYERIPSLLFYLNKHTPPYQDVSLPPGISFDLLTEEHIDLVDSCWPHRYPGSTWYFELLIKAKAGYGFFENGKLISWMFINELGVITHVYTIELYRKRGLAEILLKKVCNIRLNENKDLLVYCVATNTVARYIYNKMGFLMYDQLSWYFLKSKTPTNEEKGTL